MSGAYPSPTFQAATLENPLAVASGGTGVGILEEIAGAISASAYVQTIADLRALNTAASATTMVVAGYSAAGDQGGGTFVYNSSDTSSADNNGTIIVDSLNRRWYRQYSGSINVRWFGAVGNGTTDDTAAIQAAVNVRSSGAVYLPAGTYKTSSAITTANTIWLQGDGYNSTTIANSSATSDTIVFNAAYYGKVTDMAFVPSVTKTAGSEINLINGSFSTVQDVYISGAFIGVSVNGTVGAVIDHANIRNTVPSTGKGIVIEGANANTYLTRVFMDAPSASQPTAGVVITQTSDVSMMDCNIVHAGTDLLIAPSSSNAVASVHAVNCFFDTATRGLLIEPTGTSSVARCDFIGCEFGSMSSDGATIIGAIGCTISGVRFISCHMRLNTGNGLSVNPAGTFSDIQVIGGYYSQNSSGIAFNSSMSGFQIVGANCGAGGGTTGNSQYGIYLAGTGTYTDGIVTGCSLLGNTADAMIVGTLGANIVIDNNIGFLPEYLSKTRAIGTTYTNTSGRKLSVQVSLNVTTAGTLTGTINGLGIIGKSITTGYDQISFMVPVDGSYVLSLGSGAATIDSWYEM